MLTETMMHQTKRRTLPVEIRRREMANDVLLQHVARMEPKPAHMEYRETAVIWSVFKSE